MATDQNSPNRNDPGIDPTTPDHQLGDGEQFDNKDAPVAADKDQLEADKLRTAAENPFSPEADSAKDTEEERERQRREEGVKTDSDIETDGG